MGLELYFADGVDSPLPAEDLRDRHAVAEAQEAQEALEPGRQA